jgi:1-deoxy-D-xylulose-5-phosphate reductoisomerase
MNKGLEVIEAGWLFGFSPDQIDVLIHPQGVVHALVEFRDGSVLAQLARSDMRLAIQYALSFPKRLPSLIQSLDLAQISDLQFCYPDFDRFPCLRLAYEAARKGGTCPAVLSGADEVAVELFLEKKVSFLDIPRLVEATLSAHKFVADPDLAQLIAAEDWARQHLSEIARQ